MPQEKDKFCEHGFPLTDSGYTLHHLYKTNNSELGKLSEMLAMKQHLALDVLTSNSYGDLWRIVLKYLSDIENHLSPAQVKFMKEHPDP